MRRLLALGCALVVMMVAATVALNTRAALTIAPELTAAYYELGGVAGLGHPVSWIVREDGLVYQYFERARLEYRPAAQPMIQLGLLGAELTTGRSFPLAPPPHQSSQDRWYFAETGHSLAEPFLGFWLSQGGLRRHGYPISEPFVEGGRLVQYFERVRFELADDGGVVLAPVGHEAWQSYLTLSSQASQATLQLRQLINQTRVQQGLAPLNESPALALIAGARATDMVRRNYFSHTSPEGATIFRLLEERGISYRLAGETLQRNNFSAESAATEALRSLLASPDHRQILLNDRFQTIGIGQETDSQGLHYFVVLVIQE